MTVLMEKGTVITCPRKGHKIAMAKRDIQSSDPIRWSDFDFESGQEPDPRMRMRCAILLAGDVECRSNYFVQGCIHTSDGWKPKDPKLEKP